MYFSSRCSSAPATLCDGPSRFPCKKRGERWKLGEHLVPDQQHTEIKTMYMSILYIPCLFSCTSLCSFKCKGTNTGKIQLADNDKEIVMPLASSTSPPRATSTTNFSLELEFWLQKKIQPISSFGLAGLRDPRGERCLTWKAAGQGFLESAPQKPFF